SVISVDTGPSAASRTCSAQVAVARSTALLPAPVALSCSASSPNLASPPAARITSCTARCAGTTNVSAPRSSNPASRACCGGCTVLVAGPVLGPPLRARPTRPLTRAGAPLPASSAVVGRTRSTCRPGDRLPYRRLVHAQPAGQLPGILTAQCVVPDPRHHRGGHPQPVHPARSGVQVHLLQHRADREPEERIPA